MQDVTIVANTIYDCFFTTGTNCSLPASANPFGLNTTFNGYDLSPNCVSNAGDTAAYSLFAQVMAQRVNQRTPAPSGSSNLCVHTLLHLNLAGDNQVEN